MADDQTKVDVYYAKDFFVPAFRVYVANKERHVESDVVSLTYSDKKNAIDWAELTVNNWNPDAKGPPECWKFSDKHDFDPWQECEIWMGYYRGGTRQMRRMLVGELVRMTPHFSDGAATLTVRALGVLNRFRNRQVTKDWRDKKDSEIFSEIVNMVATQTRQAVANLTLKISDDEIKANLADEHKIKTLTIKQQYAINYLLKRAEEIDYEITAEVSQEEIGSQRTVTLHFLQTEKVKRGRPINLEWGKTLISFQPDIATANQVSEVIVRSYDPHTKGTFEGMAKPSDLVNQGVIDPLSDLDIPKGPLSQKTEIITDAVVKSNIEAQEFARNHLRNILRKLVTCKGKTIGVPGLRTGVVVRIKGCGARFDGDYVVEESTHRIDDSGYTTEFSGRMQTVPPDKRPAKKTAG
jgi:phage protein D